VFSRFDVPVLMKKEKRLALAGEERGGNANVVVVHYVVIC
jgi:hypothetical protein